jgi:hypothetical protein
MSQKIISAIKKYKAYIIIFFVCILVEIFIFNYNSITTLNCEAKTFLPQDMALNGFILNDKGRYILNAPTGSIEILNINDEVKSIYFDFEASNEITYRLRYTDDNSSTYIKNGYLFNDHVQMYSKYEKSKYLHCEYIGVTDKIRFEFNREDYEAFSGIINDYVGTIELKINKIEINRPIPFELNALRIINMLIIISFIYALFKEDFFKQAFDNSEKQKIALFLISIFVIIITLISIGGIPIEKPLDIYSKDYVDAILKGQVSLLNSPPEKLKNLEDPYDYGLRKSVLNSLWDVAYYNGNYYIYFGILPALLIFVPFRLIGIYLSSGLVAVILIVLSIIASQILLAEIINKWFKNIPFRYVMILQLFFLFNNRIIRLASRPSFYELIIASAYLLVMLGLQMIIKSDLLTDYKNVKWKQLFLGCLFLSLAVACRPLALLVSLIILPDLIKLLIHSIKEIKVNKKIIINFILFVFLPYAIIGILLAIFNYVRFDNFLEFGDSYQLTVTNTQNMEFSFVKTMLALWNFLFDVPLINQQFPFVHPNTFRPFYQGIYYIESIGGGIFTIGMLPYIIFLLPIFFKDMKKTKKYMLRFIINILLIALLMCLVFIYRYGVSGRYMVDMAWLFNLASILIVLYAYDKMRDSEYSNKIMFSLILIVVFLSCATLFFDSITGTTGVLERANLTLWYIIKDFFVFWE